MTGPLNLALVIASLVFLVALRSRVRGATLVRAWWWGLASLLGVALVETAIAGEWCGASKEAWRFLAATGTITPWMAVLGAKRPQDAAWGWIVATLWIILALPAGEILLLRPGQALPVFDLRGWFLWALLLVGPLNYLPARFFPIALWLLGFQVLLLAPHLPLLRADLGDTSRLFWLAYAVVLMAWRGLVPVQPTETGPAGIWARFRELYGLLWTLRLAERFNATAAENDWPLRLGWYGFEPAAGMTAPESPVVPIDSPAWKQLQSLLRRFVDPAWIDGKG